MITEIPEQLAAEAMGFLEPRDLGAACHALGGSQALAETACWCALRRPWDDIELYAAEETWRSLYVAHSAIASMALEHIRVSKGKRVDRSFSLTNLARSVLTGLKPREIFNTEVIRLAKRALVEISPVVSRQRLVAAARRPAAAASGRSRPSSCARLSPTTTTPPPRPRIPPWTRTSRPPMTPRHHRTEEASSAASSTGSGRGATPARRRRRERRRGSPGSAGAALGRAAAHRDINVPRGPALRVDVRLRFRRRRAVCCESAPRGPRRRARARDL